MSCMFVWSIEVWDVSFPNLCCKSLQCWFVIGFCSFLGPLLIFKLKKIVRDIFSWIFGIRSLYSFYQGVMSSITGLCFSILCGCLHRRVGWKSLAAELITILLLIIIYWGTPFTCVILGCFGNTWVLLGLQQLCH